MRVPRPENGGVGRVAPEIGRLPPRRFRIRPAPLAQALLDRILFPRVARLILRHVPALLRVRPGPRVVEVGLLGLQHRRRTPVLGAPRNGPRSARTRVVGKGATSHHEVRRAAELGGGELAASAVAAGLGWRMQRRVRHGGGGQAREGGRRVGGREPFCRRIGIGSGAAHGARDAVLWPRRVVAVLLAHVSVRREAHLILSKAPALQRLGG
mmetsp:Transcript_22642/g.49452  ORF Transcript_22642/g.49452 Transcript_22642/m.49452 type:complete len:211 (+) Transcript_22642:643-1275(+)